MTEALCDLQTGREQVPKNCRYACMHVLMHSQRSKFKFTMHKYICGCHSLTIMGHLQRWSCLARVGAQLSDRFEGCAHIGHSGGKETKERKKEVQKGIEKEREKKEGRKTHREKRYLYMYMYI